MFHSEKRLRFVKGAWGLRGPGLLESWGLRESVVSTGVVVGMVVVMAALTADASRAPRFSRSQAQPGPRDRHRLGKAWPTPPEPGAAHGKRGRLKGTWGLRVSRA